MLIHLIQPLQIGLPRLINQMRKTVVPRPETICVRIVELVACKRLSLHVVFFGGERDLMLAVGSTESGGLLVFVDTIKPDILDEIGFLAPDVVEGVPEGFVGCIGHHGFDRVQLPRNEVPFRTRVMSDVMRQGIPDLSPILFVILVRQFVVDPLGVVYDEGFRHTEGLQRGETLDLPGPVYFFVGNFEVVTFFVPGTFVFPVEDAVELFVAAVGEDYGVDVATLGEDAGDCAGCADAGWLLIKENSELSNLEQKSDTSNRPHGARRKRIRWNTPS